jgi:hypothetical protein
VKIAGMVGVCVGEKPCLTYLQATSRNLVVTSYDAAITKDQNISVNFYLVQFLDMPD